MTRTDLLTRDDWAQFAAQHPSATDMLLRLALIREYEALAALPRRTALQQERWSHLQQWMDAREAVACAGRA